MQDLGWVTGGGGGFSEIQKLNLNPLIKKERKPLAPFPLLF